MTNLFQLQPLTPPFSASVAVCAGRPLMRPSGERPGIARNERPCRAEEGLGADLWLSTVVPGLYGPNSHIAPVLAGTQKFEMVENCEDSSVPGGAL
jgi:hypothetical protein